MKNLTAIFRPLLLIVVTVIVTEWVHQRIERATERLPAAVDSLSDLVPEGPDGVTENEFEKYLRILESMQSDHALSVEHAAERETVTLDQFRDVERRVQRNDVLVERVRESLRKKAESLWDSRHAELATPTRSPAVPDL